MLQNIFSLISGCLLLGSLSAQTIYLKMDAACMDRLEYSKGDADNPYVSYAFKIGDKKFASFDVGVEGTKWVNDLPGKVTYCDALKIDNNFIGKVNDGSLKLFMVRENSMHYHIAPVDKANLMDIQGNTLDFYTEDASFSLNLSNPLSNVNLALPGSKSAFYLSGIAFYQCLKGYVLQKKETAESRSYKEYVIIPEMGIVERASVAKTGFINEPIRENDFKLAKVDDLEFTAALSGVCDRLQAKFYDGVAGNTGTPKNYDNLSTKGSTAANKTTTTATKTGGNPCAPTSEVGVHIVQKGETLYAISRRYGIPVAQLQSWNNLANTNVINACQRLFVSEPSTSAPTTTTTNTETAEKGGTVTTTTNTGYWTSTTGEHQVRTGESVASIAKMYGYTEERFRKMNGLSATETLLQGQRLRTNDCNCPTLQSTTQGTPMPYDQSSEVLTNKDGSATASVVNNQDVYYRPISVHVVKSTDTLFSIAKQYNTTIERIMELNGMAKNDKLSTDQRIYVQ